MRADPYVIEAGSGRPVVLLHAFPLNASMWAPQRQALSDSCRVLCPDQRGFGGSPLPFDDDPPSVDVLADDLAALLDAKRLSEPVVIGGLSMGGYVAMAFWRRHPERVAALILADTKGTADSAEAAANRERIAAEVVAAGDTSSLAATMPDSLLGLTTREQQPLVAGRVRALVEAAPPYAVAWAQRAMAARPDSVESLRTVDVPTLVLVGEEDEVATPEDARIIADAVPKSRLVTIPGAGHLSSMEAPEAFNAAVKEFLGELP